MSSLDEFDVVLTSERINGRFLVFVRGQQLLLSYNLFELLLELVQRHVRSAGRGYLFDNAQTFRVTICRLRKCIDQVLGIGGGKQLIQTGSGPEYRLPLKLTIAIDDRLPEETGIIPKDLLNELVTKFPQLNIEPYITSQ